MKGICLWVWVTLFCCLGSLIAPYLWAADAESNTAPGLKRLVVVEVRDETGSPEWRNQLIALGIANLVATELYNTGRYAPIEEKPEVLQELNELQALSWLGKGFDAGTSGRSASAGVAQVPENKPQPSNDVAKVQEGNSPQVSSDEAAKSPDVKPQDESSQGEKRQDGQKEPQEETSNTENTEQAAGVPEAKPVSVFERFGCDAVAKVVVRGFKTRRVRTIGFISGGSTTIELEVEVLVEEKDGACYRGVAKGEATTTSLAALFQIRDNRICFDETTVGQATQKAVKQAVANLCKVGGRE